MMRIKITRDGSLLPVIYDREVSERVVDIVIQTIEDHTLPSDPDPNAVEVSPGTWLHHGLYLRGAAANDEQQS